MRHPRFVAVVAALVAACGSTANAQLRVVNWNVTNYSSGRVADFRTAIYSSFNGRSMSPDVFIAQEIISAAGAANFLAILNSNPGGPTDWQLATFVLNSGDTSNALFYRSSKVAFLDVTTLDAGTGSGAGQPPRDNQRWHIRLVGYNSAPAELYLYGAHMKAGSASSDEARRTPECQRIRDDANTLPANTNFILGGDFNMQSWNETAYQILIAPGSIPANRFVDPIKSPGYVTPTQNGNWYNNSNYRFIHTQDPATCDAACGSGCNGGGMDDRFDQLLVSSALVDSQGMAYVGNPNVAYSTSTWNDPNHSYRCWGNDGSGLNCRLTVTGNTMVGPAIAQSLINSANGLGHLPVFLDLQVPAKLATTPTTINFGTVNQNAAATFVLNIANSVNVSLWSREGNGTGIDDLDYSLAATTGFAAPGGQFSALAGVAGNNHTISMSTATVGHKVGTLTVTSDDPDQPTRVIQLVGDVVVACACDWNHSGSLNSQDLFDFITSFFALNGDFNHDGQTNSQDFFDFVTCFFSGC